MLKTTQKLYRENNSEELILSPYVVINPLNGFRIQIERKDKGKYVVLEASNYDTLIYLVDNLRKGMSREKLNELLCMLDVRNTETWIDLCLKKGVLE